MCKKCDNCKHESWAWAAFGIVLLLCLTYCNIDRTKIYNETDRSIQSSECVGESE